MTTVILDRDGVINLNRQDHVKAWSEFEFLPGVPEAISRLNQLGIPVFVITNQAIINRHISSRQTIQAINIKMLQQLRRLGARIEAVSFCPHRPEEDCSCRKPRSGMLLDLAQRFNLNLKDVVLIGDALSDIQAGQSVGCQTILVLTGRGHEQLKHAASSGTSGFKVASDLSAAIPLAIQHNQLAAPPVSVPRAFAASSLA